MEKEFIPYEQALALKELGFYEQCFGFFEKIINNYHTISSNILSVYADVFLYDEENENYHFYFGRSNVSDAFEDQSNYILAPTYSQAFKWFREKHSLFHFITREIGINTSEIFFVGTFYKGKKGNSPKNTCISSKTYEEAELECLKKLIEIVKNGK